jgi:hypothetical protein
MAIDASFKVSLNGHTDPRLQAGAERAIKG